jgi:dTMP kinase
MGLELEHIIKNRNLSRSSLTDLLLFTANRIELYRQVIEPEINKGTHIIADRNWISSIVYQGFASGLDTGIIRQVTAMMLPENYSHPDATLLLSLSSDRRQQLLGNRGTSDGDYFETKPDEFQRKLIEGYESIADDLQLVSESVSASGTIEEVHGRILASLERMQIITD